MNKFEKFFYDILKHNPRLKLFIRDKYQGLFDLLPRPRPLSAFEITAREGFFFGFHDHTPFSADNRKILAHRYNIPLRMPKPGEEVEIGFFDGDNFNEFHPIAYSRAWSWHLGSKLQWRGSSDQVVFNDHVNGKNISRVMDIATGEESQMPGPVGSVSLDGRWAVGYSFSRVENCMPGYGYPYQVDDPEENSSMPEGHGIHRIDLDSGERQDLFSISDIARIEPTANMKEARHFFSHAVFSPDSRRIIFLHRWIQGGIYKRHSRMVSSDINGENLYIFPTSGMVSHIGWRDPEHVIAYCSIPGQGDQYILFRDQVPDDLRVIGPGFFNSDGHPSFDPTGRWIVTDTYPDRSRVQSLLIFDTRDEKGYNIAKLPTPGKFQSGNPFEHWSCDLHPRWDRKGRYICFDSTYTGTRSLCTLDLGEDLGNNEVRHISHKRVEIE